MKNIILTYDGSACLIACLLLVFGFEPNWLNGVLFFGLGLTGTLLLAYRD